MRPERGKLWELSFRAWAAGAAEGSRARPGPPLLGTRSSWARPAPRSPAPGQSQALTWGVPHPTVQTERHGSSGGNAPAEGRARRVPALHPAVGGATCARLSGRRELALRGVQGGRGGTCGQVIGELGLHPKDGAAPRECLMLAETYSDEGFRELRLPKGVDERTRLGGGEGETGQVSSPSPGREEVGQRTGLGVPDLPPDPPSSPLPALCSGTASVTPSPTLPWLPVSLDSSPEIGEFPQFPPGWAHTCLLSEAPGPALRPFLPS